MTTPQGTPQVPSLMNLPEGLSPDAIDTLPVLSALLSRLQTPTSTNNTSTSGSPPAVSPSQLASGNGLLTIKDIPAATDEMKHKLQKARAHIKDLPDIHRSLAEQDEEIRELEEKIQRQREVLEDLRDVGNATKTNRESTQQGGGSDPMQT